MIIWLASYPKSGNTWVRSIVSSLLYSDDGIFNFELLKNIQQFPEKKFLKDFVKNFNDFDEIKRNWILAQEKINLAENINLLKTHQGKYTVGEDNFTNNENTSGVIYIVRDPRNLVQSISNHFTLSIEEAQNFLLSPQIIGNGKNWNDKKDGLYNLLGKWNDHYRSWTRNKQNLLIIKYEDLLNNTELELERLIKFLERFLSFETNKSKKQNIIKTTSFENLKQLERKGLFKENVLNKETKSEVNFFHLGPENKWQKILDDKIKLKIEENFRDEMKELGYIN
tara:strand:- start:85 stop:930 length:846 start_codon:yes stop_codon:yes gene_type:complete